jgi:hypothetical protein
MDVPVSLMLENVKLYERTHLQIQNAPAIQTYSIREKACSRSLRNKSLFNMFQNPTSILLSLPPNDFNLILKKFLKKDSMTRKRALQEMKEWIETSKKTVEEMKVYDFIFKSGGKIMKIS